jgi:hypothetical protein
MFEQTFKNIDDILHKDAGFRTHTYVKVLVRKFYLCFKDANIDFSNMFNSMFNASKLHSALKRKIHPDLFPNNPEKILIANDLTARLNESQNDIAKMKEIQAIAKEKLGIIF